MPTTDDKVAEIRAPHERRWEYRGTVFWIFVEVAGSVGKHVVALCAMAMSVMVTDPDNCEEYVDVYSLSKLDEVVCFYTGSYLYCFPALATAAAFILVARDLLHKRFYYGMLKSGVVIDYKYTNPISDPMMWLLLWNFFHLFWYIGFIFYILWKTTDTVAGRQVRRLAAVSFSSPCILNVTSHASRHLRATGVGLVGLLPDPTTLTSSTTMLDLVEATTTTHNRPCGMPIIETIPGIDPGFAEHILKKVIVTLGAIIIPGILFVIFFYLDYNLERHLVPLSEFLDTDEDEEAGKDRTQAAEGALKNLVVCGDADMRDIVTDSHRKFFLPHAEELSQTAAFALLIKAREEWILRERTERRSQWTSQMTPGKNQKTRQDDADSSDDIEQPYNSFRAKKLTNQKNADDMTVYFIDSLWPGQLLLSRNLIGDDAKQFRHLCYVYLAFSSVVTAMVLAFLGISTASQVHLVLQGVVEASVSAFVRGFHLLVVGFLFMRMVIPLGFHHGSEPGSA